MTANPIHVTATDRVSKQRAARGLRLGTCAVVWLAGALAPVHSAIGQIQQGNLTIGLDKVAGGLTSPVSLTHAGDGSGRLFVVDQAGQIRIVDNTGTLRPTPFLDLSATIPALRSTFDERGLLGLAFHPDYRNNGRFFVRHSAPRPGAPGEPCFGTVRGCHEEILAEYRVSAGDPNVANPAGKILFRVDEPEFNHNGGGVAFGPDGFLYFSLGDGGGANDGLHQPTLPHGPTGNGQNIDTALGSMLRIDVNGPNPYSIPPTNPFVGRPGLDEIYAYGLRNPYRFSFDDGPGGSGRLYLGDVGQNRFEEIDIIQNGGNYGWVIREGFHCFDPFNPNTPPASCATTGAMGEPLLDPVAEYDHIDGLSVILGGVYRGSQHPELVGKLIFGDWSRSFAAPDGRLLFIDVDGGPLADIREFRLGSANNPLGRYVLGFGEGEDGELYLLTTNNAGPTGFTGQVWRIVPEPACVALMLTAAVATLLRRRRRC